MLTKLMMKRKELDLNYLNNFLLLCSVFMLAISLFLVRNIYLIALIYLLVYEFYYHQEKNKYISFLISIIPIIIFACFLLRYLDLGFFKFDVINLIKIVINFLIFFTYTFTTFLYIKNKNIKYVKGRSRKRTFKDLRIKNIKRYQNANLETITAYQKANGLELESDYYKVLKNNLNNKTITDLEEYVWLNYLRFYKNKKYHKNNIFDKLNLVFIGIHVIILLLAILVR